MIYFFFNFYIKMHLNINNFPYWLRDNYFYEIHSEIDEIIHFPENISRINNNSNIENIEDFSNCLYICNFLNIIYPISMYNYAKNNKLEVLDFFLQIIEKEGIRNGNTKEFIEDLFDKINTIEEYEIVKKLKNIYNFHTKPIDFFIIPNLENDIEYENSDGELYRIHSKIVLSLEIRLGSLLHTEYFCEYFSNYNLQYSQIADAILNLSNFKFFFENIINYDNNFIIEVKDNQLKLFNLINKKEVNICIIDITNNNKENLAETFFILDRLEENVLEEHIKAINDDYQLNI